MTITMIARKSLVYAGARVAKGGKFEVRGQSDARALQAIGSAEPVAAVPVPVKPLSPPVKNVAALVDGLKYEVVAINQIDATFLEQLSDEAILAPSADDDSVDAPADNAAAEQTTEDADISPRTGKPKRQYRRRDMTSEGSEG